MDTNAKGAKDVKTKLHLLRLSLQITRFDGAAAIRKTVLPRHKVQRWLRHALQTPAEITVRVVDADEGRALNHQYRGKDYATNVLTFAYSTEPTVCADLILCAPVLWREAQEQGKDLQAHYVHMLVHGALHALGYDHERDEAEAEEMEAEETELLRFFGFANPYGCATGGD